MRWLVFFVIVGFFAGYAVADELDADKVLAKFGEFQKQLKDFKVEVRSSIEVENRKIRHCQQESFLFSASKPNRFAMVLTSGLAGPTVVCDGQKVYSYRQGLNQYVVSGAATDFDIFLSQPSLPVELLQRTIPLSGILLSSDPYKMLRQNGFVGEYTGLVEIDGVKCHQLKKDTLQLWFEAGDKPFLRRVSVSMTSGEMEFSAVWRFVNWQVNTSPDAKLFGFSAPVGAEEVKQFSQMNPADSQYGLMGKEAPDFELDLLGGGKMKLSEHRGKAIVMLDFWALRCPPCRAAMPKLIEVADKYKDKGVVFYAVNVEDVAEAIKKYLKQANYKVSVPLGGGSDVSNKYGVRAIPTTVIVDKKGIVRVAHIGVPADAKEAISHDIESVLMSDKVDLGCGEFSFVPDSVKVGDKVSFKCVIKNNGSELIRHGRYSVGLAVDGKDVYFGIGMKDIQPGGAVEYSVDVKNWYFKMEDAGEHKYVFSVDPQNAILELDESNNSISGVFGKSKIKD